MQEILKWMKKLLNKNNQSVNELFYQSKNKVSFLLRMESHTSSCWYKLYCE